jgi:hypothetical protein
VEGIELKCFTAQFLNPHMNDASFHVMSNVSLPYSVNVSWENQTDKETYKTYTVAVAELTAKQLFFSRRSCALLSRHELIWFDLGSNGRQAGKDSHR